MSILSFIKENRVLVAGLILPFLLVLFFMLAKLAPAATLTPPTHKVLYSSQGWSSRGNITFALNEKGSVVATFKTFPQNQQNQGDPAPISLLYLYDPQTATTEEIKITLDKDDNPIIPAKIKSLSLSATQPSDEGYIFEPYAYNNNHSFFMEIFSPRTYSNAPMLRKDGKTIQLPEPSTRYSSFEFIGWVHHQE